MELLGIHQALGVLFADEHDGIDWLRQPHVAPVFGGHPPLVVSPYDAELYGHWWFEGPQFIDFFFKKLQITFLAPKQLNEKSIIFKFQVGR